MANERPILTVTQLNEYIKGIIDGDKVLSGLTGIGFNTGQANANGIVFHGKFFGKDGG